MADRPEHRPRTSDRNRDVPFPIVALEDDMFRTAGADVVASVPGTGQERRYPAGSDLAAAAIVELAKLRGARWSHDPTLQERDRLIVSFAADEAALQGLPVTVRPIAISAEDESTVIVTSDDPKAGPLKLAVPHAAARLADAHAKVTSAGIAPEALELGVGKSDVDHPLLELSLLLPPAVGKG